MILLKINTVYRIAGGTYLSLLSPGFFHRASPALYGGDINPLIG